MFEETAIRALLMSTIAGFSTMIGALIIFVTKGKNEKLISASLAFAGGVMISVSYTELIPSALSYFGGDENQVRATIFMVLFLILGIVFASLLDKFVPHEESQETHEAKHENLYRVGFISTLALALHNFPEGIATFMAGFDSMELGITIALAIAFHNIPEGITVALPIYFSTGSKKKALWYTFLSSVTEPLGALLAFALLRPIINDFTLGIIFALISGIMLYIAIEELLPSSKDYGYPKLALYATFAGICLMPLTMMF